MNYNVAGHGEDTWITISWGQRVIQGHLNTLICDGGYYDDRDEFIPFPGWLTRRLYEIDAQE